MMHPYLTLLARLLLGAVWIAAGVAKLADKESRGDAVAAFGLLPARVAALTGTALPYAELALGTLLLAGLETRAAAAASAALLLSFSAAIALNLARGRRIECRCFGQVGRKPISWWSVARNVALLAPAICLALFPSGYLSLDGWRRGAASRLSDAPPVGFVPVLLLALAAAVLWALAASTWELMTTAAGADEGPGIGLPEHRYLRRWLGANRRAGESVVAGTAARNGR